MSISKLTEHRSMAEIDTSKRIVYRVDGMERIAPQRNLVYRRDNGTDLLMDVYTPLGVSPGARLPAVIFVHGPIPPEMLPPKDWGIFRSYGELAAASGLIGVTFNHRLHTPLQFPESQANVAMINQGIDLFVQEALAGNASLDLANHSTGRHGFDCLDDDDRSRTIISNAIAFAKAYLNPR